tara:strand:- start:7419 stop:7577 length:159 start_codon:yes stop_codon:yes gene_type:complete
MPVLFQKKNLEKNGLFKKIPFVNKLLAKKQKDLNSQNYNEMVKQFIIKVKNN